MPGNEMIGFVVNDKHPKSVRVFCDRFMHVMRYKKTFRYTKKIWAHDENSECRLGDIVQVQPLGYRMGPMKTYVVRSILHQEPRDAADKSCLRGSDARNLTIAHGEDEQQKDECTTVTARIASVTATGEGLAQVVIYNVDVTYVRDGESQEFKVKRRFSDFLWLRSMLSDGYTNRIVPPLAGKRVISSYAASEVEGIRFVLQLFLTRITNDNDFIHHSATKAFLTYSWDNLANFKSAACSSSAVSRNSSDGLQGVLNGMFDSIRRGRDKAMSSLGMLQGSHQLERDGSSSVDAELSRAVDAVESLDRKLNDLSSAWKTIRLGLRRYGEGLNELSRQCGGEYLKTSSREIRSLEGMQANLVQYHLEDLAMHYGSVDAWCSCAVRDSDFKAPLTVSQLSIAHYNLRLSPNVIDSNFTYYHKRYLHVCQYALARQASMEAELVQMEKTQANRMSELTSIVDAIHQIDDDKMVSVKAREIKRIDCDVRTSQVEIHRKRQQLKDATDSLKTGDSSGGPPSHSPDANRPPHSSSSLRSGLGHRSILRRRPESAGEKQKRSNDSEGHSEASERTFDDDHLPSAAIPPSAPPPPTVSQQQQQHHHPPTLHEAQRCSDVYRLADITYPPPRHGKGSGGISRRGDTQANVEFKFSSQFDQTLTKNRSYIVTTALSLHPGAGKSTILNHLSGPTTTRLPVYEYPHGRPRSSTVKKTVKGVDAWMTLDRIIVLDPVGIGLLATETKSSGPSNGVRRRLSESREHDSAQSSIVRWLLSVVDVVFAVVCTPRELEKVQEIISASIPGDMKAPMIIPVLNFAVPETHDTTSFQGPCVPFILPDNEQTNPYENSAMPARLTSYSGLNDIIHTTPLSLEVSFMLRGFLRDKAVSGSSRHSSEIDWWTSACVKWREQVARQESVEDLNESKRKDQTMTPSVPS
ncbi:hypothetical protein FOL47_007844 [Perkinsus chesapeaki]|uniref:PX domain-containing protein n=1 Tax=Perkinsus chesapeaki TaxID=330153 RepID=A0A7J6MVC7_PERCH|nr:hypothetical protein FOL47_007844 [Perkinsus chesapeaki]